MIQNSEVDLKNRRPTSPHMSIYKPQISSTLSIFHRATGVGLFGGALVAAWWFIITVFSKFDTNYTLHCNCMIIKASLFCLSFAGFYHLCTGIRHLIWDSGKCFEIKYINLTGWIAVFCACAMTAGFWLFIVSKI